MRFVDIAADLATVLSASRSVASKHIALRGRQLDVYTRNSRNAAAARVRTDQAQPDREPDFTEEDVGINNQSTDGVVKASADAQGVAQTAQASHGHFATPLNETNAESWQQSLHKATPANISDNSQYLGSRSIPRTAADGDNVVPEDTPTDANVNIFHTARGSKILESVRDAKRRNASETRTPHGGPSKVHPLRYWPYPPPGTPDQPQETMKSEPSPTSHDVNEPETMREDSVVYSDPVSPPFQPEPALDVDSPTPKPAVDQETEDILKDLSHAHSHTTPAYQLRESKVPSSRFSRIWNYGGLAAGMLGGAMTEGVSRAFGGAGTGSVLLSGNNMERLVSKLSQMRGAALKLGQMISFQDSKTLPAPLQQVLQRVQDRADYMPAWQRDRVMVANLGTEWRDMFTEFEEKPMAAASIGQVHKATLKSNGKRVAVKIQFPGVADSINSDLDNMGILLSATKLLPKGLYLNKTIDNARTELGWECDYERELECAKRYKELLHDEADVFVAPGVYPEASGKQVLTMDFMDGIGVTRIDSFTQEQRDWIGTNILRLCLREITEFKFMQTDPNWTNFLYNDKIGKLELLDFGASREYPDEFLDQYIRLLAAASRSDKEGVKTLSESLGYLTGHESKTMVDAHVKSVMTLAEPFLAVAPEVYDFKDQTITERVRDLIPVMLHERLAPPPEETYSLHRKLSGAFLLCARLGSKVRCREMFDDSLIKTGYMKRQN